MLAAPLFARIEKNWEQIVGQIIERRNRDPHLSHYRNLSTNEICSRVRDLTSNLARWFDEPDERRVLARYEDLGHERFKEGIPLAEVLEKVLMIKRHIRQYTAEHNLALTPMEIYAEVEALRTMANFFDLVVVGVARGYTAAAGQAPLRRSA